MGDVIQHCVFTTRGYMVAANGVNTLIVPMRRRVVERGQSWRVDAHRAFGERSHRHLVYNQDILVLFLVLVQIGFYGEDVVHIWERDIYTAPLKNGVNCIYLSGYIPFFYNGVISSGYKTLVRRFIGEMLHIGKSLSTNIPI
jgi:hypothetical protein